MLACEMMSVEGVSSKRPGGSVGPTDARVSVFPLFDQAVPIGGNTVLEVDMEGNWVKCGRIGEVSVMAWMGWRNV